MRRAHCETTCRIRYKVFSQRSNSRRVVYFPCSSQRNFWLRDKLQTVGDIRAISNLSRSGIASQVVKKERPRTTVP